MLFYEKLPQQKFIISRSITIQDYMMLYLVALMLLTLHKLLHAIGLLLNIIVG
jgi:hypothetical protein